ncbi:hypothetical protein C1M55_28250 [Rhodococcus qingshengii]|uniref:hypothetical protein n=1 Tax=Rhodococcus qingshengii TaxID=334542 RepID=UPI000C9F4A68|nr:hypothetical protein [Rhodococcus qingshengii]AUS34623.1 hypothetical protein C1M55_28250 [Rhodococcus qingshengii]
MIWPIKTVRELETLQLVHLVSSEVHAQSLPYHLSWAAKELEKAAKERLGVDIDIRNCEHKLIEEDHDDHTRKYVSRWRPLWMNADVEFVDGPLDGKLYAVPNIHGPIIAAIESDIDAFRISGDPNPREFDLAVPKRITYNLAGWNDRTRRWVFSPEGSAT